MFSGAFYKGICMIFDLQKAGLLKRFSAYLLDFILLCVLAVGFALAVSAITGYEGYLAKYSEQIEIYEENYGKISEVTEEFYNGLSADAKACYDEVARLFATIQNLILLMTSSGIFLAYFILEFLLPLKFRNGQTVGKKVFGLAVMHLNFVKVSGISMFIRTMLGKYTIETMFPILIVILIFFGGIGFIGTLILFALLILQIVMFFTSGTYSTIHDLLAKTVVVDLSSQMIFDSEEKMIEAKKSASAQEAERQQY